MSKDAAPMSGILPASHGSGRATLESFPVELLEKILLNLNGGEVVSCQRISRAFQDVVAASLRLQYHIECFLARVVDNPQRQNVVLRERLEKVKGWRDAFGNYRWTGRTQITITHPTDDEGYVEEAILSGAFGPVYVLQSWRCITIIQPPSDCKGRDEKKWVIQDPGFLPQGFAYDADQQILALVEKMDERRYRVRLMTPSGLPHPLATVPILSVSVPEPHINLEMYSDCRVVFYLDLLLVCVDREDEFGDTEVWIFNWQTGELLLNVWGFENESIEPRGVAFLDRDHILLPLIDTYASDDLISIAGVAILCIYPSNPRRRATPEVAPDAKVFLSLPKPLEGADYNRIIVFGKPLPSPGDVSATEDIFVHHQDASLVGISFDITAVAGRTVTHRTFDVLVPREFIKSLLVTPHTGSRAPMVTIPWDDWAPHARMFRREPADDPRPGHPLLLASRCFIGPHAIADNLDIVAFDFAPNLNERHRVHEDSFTQPSTISEPRIWANPLHIGSKLSFLRSDIKSIPRLESPDDHFIVGEDFIVVLRPTKDEKTIVETYWI